MACTLYEARAISFVCMFVRSFIVVVHVITRGEFVKNLNDLTVLNLIVAGSLNDFD